MASRQKQPAEDPQQGLEEEETVSGAGEGDEIMEEVEEQEDGYSEFIITLFDPFALLSLLPRLLVPLRISCLASRSHLHLLNHSP